MSWKTLLDSVSGSLNDHIRLRNEYLLAENRILRNQIDGRVHLTDSERKELAEIGAKLGKKALEEIATVAQPDTILAWNRKFADQQLDPSKSSKSVGRPRVDQEIEDLVIRMARENRSWGYDRIQGALNHLGYTISDQTVGNILKRQGISPAPERKKTVTWREFVRSHLDVLRATHFFKSNVWSRFGLMISYLLLFLHFCTCQVHLVTIVLQYSIQRIRSFGMRFLNLRTDSYRGILRGRQRFPAMPYGEAILEIPVYDLASSDENELPSQDRGNVLFLSAVHPRPIRDGPIQRGQPLNERLLPDYHEAAHIPADLVVAQERAAVESRLRFDFLGLYHLRDALRRQMRVHITSTISMD